MTHKCWPKLIWKYLSVKINEILFFLSSDFDIFLKNRARHGKLILAICSTSSYFKLVPCVRKCVNTWTYIYSCVYMCMYVEHSFRINIFCPQNSHLKYRWNDVKFKKLKRMDKSCCWCFFVVVSNQKKKKKQKTKTNKWANK